MKGEIHDEVYHSPEQAYDLPLTLNVFRGDVIAVEESCDETGGSTTFWDSIGRQFQVDYLFIDENYLAHVPRFASDETVMNLVFNNYLRKVVRKSDKIVRAHPVHRAYMRNEDIPGLYALVDMDVDARYSGDSAGVRGTYYYGFYVFKKKDKVYVVQHRQPALMKEKMLETLITVAEGLEIPSSYIREETESEEFIRSSKNVLASIGMPVESRDKPLMANTCR